MNRILKCPNCEQPIGENRKIKLPTDKTVKPTYELESFFEYRCAICGTRIQIPEETAIHKND